MNRKCLAMLMGGLAFVFWFCAASPAAEAEPEVGQMVGQVKFAKPLSNEDAKYLGLDQAAAFSLQDIKAPYVLVEQMNNT